jgi:hypothetical protein
LSEQNQAPIGTKADFGEAYVAADPRPYFRQLGQLGYEIPHHGQQIFRHILDALGASEPLVVDLCSSYGVNAALLKHDLTLAHLYEHYRADEITDLTRGELVSLDRQFYAPLRRANPPWVVGIDCSRPAVDYAFDVGLLDVGAAEDLEVDDPSRGLAALIRDADLITVTGGIGYITERTFDRLLACTRGTTPWIAALCLRTVDFHPIAACLHRHGLVTERLPELTFPQRRFADDTEQAYALRQLAALGVDPTGREADGLYHVDLYLSRPPHAARTIPLTGVLAELSPSTA